MDFWLVALRGPDDALVEARALLGSPLAWLETVHLFGLETADPAIAVRTLATVAKTEGVAGASALAGADHDGARERALALCCAAGTGEILCDAQTRARLDGEALFVRAKPRPGWRLPVQAVALLGQHSQRSECRAAAALLPATPKLIAREREIAAIVALLAMPGPIVVEAVPGAGAGRVLDEVAARADVRFIKLSPFDAVGGDALTALVTGLSEGEWLVLDPVDAPLAERARTALESLPEGAGCVLRASPDVPIPYVTAERRVTVGALRQYDAQALVQALLGAETDARIARRLARRSGELPGPIVEAVRAAVQLGQIERAGDRWGLPARRPLKPRDVSRDPLVRRLADVPGPILRALRALYAAGDGATKAHALAAIRGASTSDPEERLKTLHALGFMRTDDERVQLSASVASLLPPRDECVTTLARVQALQAAAEGENMLRAGRLREASRPFATASRLALQAGLRASAVRYVAAALPHGAKDERTHPDVRAVLAQVLAAIAPVIRVDVLEADPSVREQRVLDPEQLELTATQLADRNDGDGAERLRALAEVMRGNSQRALRMAGAQSNEGSSKAQLVAALAQASAGEVHVAVRTALAALVIARRASEKSGEAAALAVLSTLYRVAGREEESKLLAESARKLQVRPAGEPAPQGA